MLTPRQQHQRPSTDVLLEVISANNNMSDPMGHSSSQTQEHHHQVPYGTPVHRHQEQQQPQTTPRNKKQGDSPVAESSNNGAGLGENEMKTLMHDVASTYKYIYVNARRIIYAFLSLILIVSFVTMSGTYAVSNKTTSLTDVASSLNSYNKTFTLLNQILSILSSESSGAAPRNYFLSNVSNKSI